MIAVDPLKECNLLFLQVLKDEIDFNPLYQREGDIWPLSKRQLFIDSIINGMDIPKLYFHELANSRPKKYKYAVVDGKQRLEALYSFLNDEFPIAVDFKDLTGEGLDFAGKFYSEFSQISKRFKMQFDARQLPIYVIKTSDLDLIEEMFYRLNESAPLNAAEKRNSIAGPFPKISRNLSQHNFFQYMTSFSSKRYKNLDAIAKLLLLCFSQKIVETKKVHLDIFAKSLAGVPIKVAKDLEKTMIAILDEWIGIFAENDRLLRSPSALPVYYIVYTELIKRGKKTKFKRAKILEFENARASNRELARSSEESEDIQYNWLEYDRLTQSPNDSSSIRFRANELLAYIGEPKLEEPTD